MASGTQDFVFCPGDGDVLDRHATPVIDGIDQTCLTGSSSGHPPRLSRTSRDGSDARQATEALVISVLEQTGCLRKERCRHRCSHTGYGVENLHIPRPTSRRGRFTSRIWLRFSGRRRDWSLLRGERCGERFHGVFRLADMLLNQRKLLQQQFDARSCCLQDAGSRRDGSRPQALENLLRIQTPNPMCFKHLFRGGKAYPTGTCWGGNEGHRAIITGEDSENPIFRHCGKYRQSWSRT